MVDGNQNLKSDKKSIRVSIVDYGMGNVRSVQCALESLGCSSTISSRRDVLQNSDALILPGVGAFGKAMENLTELGLLGILHEEVIEKRKPILGICLGMQLFAESSTEMGEHAGLGWIPGQVVKINPTPKLSLPHVGWNELHIKRSSDLFLRIEEKTHFYFDHTFCFECDERYVISTVNYGGPLVSGVRSQNIIGYQFHPEKSQTAGLKLLRNFLNFSAGVYSC